MLALARLQSVNSDSLTPPTGHRSHSSGVRGSTARFRRLPDVPQLRKLWVRALHKYSTWLRRKSRQNYSSSGLSSGHSTTGSQGTSACKAQTSAERARSSLSSQSWTRDNNKSGGRCFLHAPSTGWARPYADL